MAAEKPAQHISDEAVRAKTGKGWDEWFRLLDEVQATSMAHPEIVRWLRANHEPGRWWEQTITVAYERARGLRQKHEMPDGYQASKSKTIAATANEVFAAWSDVQQRGLWLEGADQVVIRKQTQPKSLRITWIDGVTDVDVYITEKTADRAVVAINHRKLADADTTEHMKKFWAEQLANLSALLARR